ncbi:MAG: hypothetical protein ACLR6J_02660 [Parabacteroides merdae]
MGQGYARRRQMEMIIAKHKTEEKLKETLDSISSGNRQSHLTGTVDEGKDRDEVVGGCRFQGKKERY